MIPSPNHSQNLKMMSLCLLGMMPLVAKTNAMITGGVNIKNLTECTVTPLLDGLSQTQVRFKPEQDNSLLVNFEEKPASLAAAASHQYTIPVLVACDTTKYAHQVLISLQPTYARITIEAHHHFTPTQLVVSGDNIIDATSNLVTLLVLPQKLAG